MRAAPSGAFMPLLTVPTSFASAAALVIVGLQSTR